ncbi:MAG: hypothetical protein ACXWJD_07575 [Burkholderiaceae bacterium]
MLIYSEKLSKICIVVRTSLQDKAATLPPLIPIWKFAVMMNKWRDRNMSDHKDKSHIYGMATIKFVDD